MKTWLRLLLVTLAVGGGFTGVLMTGEQFGKMNIVILVIMLGLYSFITVSGLIFVYDPKCKRPLLAALALQIPWISSPWLGYECGSGLHAALTLVFPDALSRTGLHPGIHFLFGSHFMFRIGDYHGGAWSLGVNTIAVIFFVLLLRSTRPSGTKQQPVNSVSPPSLTV